MVPSQSDYINRSLFCEAEETGADAEETGSHSFLKIIYFNLMTTLSYCLLQ